MAAPAQKVQFALDTNVLIDLGEGKPFALAFLKAYSGRGLCVPPTVVQELTAIGISNTHPASEYALEALSSMRSWNVYPYDLKSVGHGIAEANARKLIDRRLLPEEEFQDGLILIETALAEIPNLVTSDKHLLRISKSALTKTLSDFDLAPVQIFHPNDLLGAIH
jgi:predicted nucleic acid-binding protein